MTAPPPPTIAHPARALTSRCTAPGVVWLLLLATLVFPRSVPLTQAAAPDAQGASVLVIYNKRLPESKEIAEHYQRVRGVPETQVAGFDLATGESISRLDFRETLLRPLLHLVKTRNLMTWAPVPKPADASESRPLLALQDSRIRYLVLCHGVPVKILADDKHTEPGMEALRPELRRNEAAVDSELTLLPFGDAGWPLYGAVDNPAFRATNQAQLHPTNGILLVARLDGPTAAIARSLVDKAVEAETNGFWGRAYFDHRSLTNGSYRIGDEWIRTAAAIAARVGFETTVDGQPETFRPAAPLSHIALYAGWYDAYVSGPFARPSVEFMPGAIAYHLHSFSASLIRTADQYWVGPLLAKGAAATMGCVAEPYLEATPNLALFFERLLLMGFTFGEAAWASQPGISWQITVVGDPLYRPGGINPAELHARLVRENNRNLEWSHLRLVNLNLAIGAPPGTMISYLQNERLTSRSPLLLEKLADLSYANAKFNDAIHYYDRALRLTLTPQQKIRLLLSLARACSLYEEHERALTTYLTLGKEFPDYPDRIGLLEKQIKLGRELKKTAEVQAWTEELNRLSPPPQPKP